MAEMSQTWRQWALAIPSITGKAIIQSWKMAAWNPCGSATQTLKRWMRKNRRPVVAYNRSPRDRAPPVPLPKIRKRALSIGAVSKPTLLDRMIPSKEIQVTYSQKQSLFITKLPPEIRLIIYQYVLGGRVLHIIPSLVPSRTNPPSTGNALVKFKLPPTFISRLDYEPCKWSTDPKACDMVGGQHPHSACAIWINRQGELYFNAPQSIMRGECDIETRFLRWWIRKNRALSLVKTCRLVYSESISVLYSENTFDFRSLQTFSQFPTTLLPERLNSIRSVHIRFNTTPTEIESREKWVKICKVLQGMKGLREVCLVGEYHKRATDRATARLLEELERLKMDGNFVVRGLPYPV